MFDLFFVLLNGLSNATLLFLIASGLSLVFGVTRIVNFAHGGMCMLGLYFAYSFTNYFTDFIYNWDNPSVLFLAYWLAILISALVVAAIGAVLEIVILRKVYHAHELIQLLTTFAILLIIKDAVLAIWGAEDLFAMRAVGFSDSINIFRGYFSYPTYRLFLIFAGIGVFAMIYALLHKTRFGLLIRAASVERGMTNCLGINQKWLFTATFTLGAFLAGLAGAMTSALEPANLNFDHLIIIDAFVVVVIGGLGSISGALFAAILIGIVKSLCFYLGDVYIAGLLISFSKLTLIIEFLLMALVIAIRPFGLLGKEEVLVDNDDYQPSNNNYYFGKLEKLISKTYQQIQAFSLSINNSGLWLSVALLVLLIFLPLFNNQYLLVLATEGLIILPFVLGLFLLIVVAGVLTFGHVVFFGLGAYIASILYINFSSSFFINVPLSAFIGAFLGFIIGRWTINRSGVYLAMLTLAVSQIFWSIVYQSQWLTGGSNGLIGIRLPTYLDNRTYFYEFTVILISIIVFLLMRYLRSPAGYLVLAMRDSPARLEALGVSSAKVKISVWMIAGFLGSLSGALFAYAKGSISPDVFAITRSVDGLMMLILGGMTSLWGTIVGAFIWLSLQDWLIRNTEYWQSILGTIVLFLIIIFHRNKKSI